jgi:protein TonB
MRTRPVPRTLDPTPVAAAANAPIAAPEDSGSRDAGRDEPLVEARYNVATLNNPKPPYPLAARRRGLQGRVLLTAHVLADGRCEQVEVRHSSGHELLDIAARDTVRHWRFLPARRGDTPVDAWVEVPITFRLDS